MSSTRILTLRSSSSAFRAVTRRTTLPRQLMRPAARRGYADAHDAAAKTSELPWLAGSVGVTVVGLAFIFSGGSPKKDSHHGDDTHAEEKHSKEDEQQQGEKGGDDNDDEGKKEGGEEQGGVEESKSEGKDEDEGEGGDGEGEGDAPSKPESSGKSSQTGKAVPPPSSDNSSPAENQDEKKKGHEEVYKEQMIEGKQTKVASSTPEAPTKKASAENPKEDPQKGEGEGVKKGGSS